MDELTFYFEKSYKYRLFLKKGIKICRKNRLKNLLIFIWDSSIFNSQLTVQKCYKVCRRSKHE